ncbi:MAG: diphthamide synthesis protein [Nanoarchaeota archaeon]
MYNLELDKLIQEIKRRNSKQVLIQLPDGLKNKSNHIVDFIEDKTNAKAFIWFGGCFGACDLPLGLDILKIDLIVQWGHNKFNKEEW